MLVTTYLELFLALPLWLNGVVATDASSGVPNTTAIYLDPSYSPAKRAQDVLQRMTWEEKIGQMGGVRRLLGTNLSFNDTAYSAIHSLQNGILGFGSQLNPAPDVLPIANRIRAQQVNTSRLRIPYITATDSLNGIYLAEGTLFPATLSIGSSWNVPLYEQVVAAIRDENMACGVHWVLSPELDVAKEPRNGRLGEMYSEDTYLNGEFGVAYVKVMQEKDEQGYVKVATTIKHFIYSLPTGGINTASQAGGVNHIFNDLAAPFIRVIKEAQPLSLMASYASIDRVPMSINKFMLQTVLRKTIGFTGVIISDALAILHLHTQSKVARTLEAAGLLALDAGLQLELSPSQPAVFPTLVSASNNSKAVAQVNEAVQKLLELKFSTGAFDRPLPTVDGLNSTLRKQSHLDTNRNISRESIVLLKNDGLLPLKSKDGSWPKVALLGPFANIINAGSYAANNSTNKAFGKTLRDSLDTAFGIDHVTYVQGVDIVDTNDTSEIETAVAAAKSAGLAILALGSLSVNGEDPLFSKRTDGEFFSHADLGFPGLQQRLLDSVVASGVPTILILSGGQPFVLSDTALLSNSIVHAFLGGEFTGDALVEILTGAINPSGKLTISMPQSTGAEPIYYDYLPSDNQGGPSGGTLNTTTAWQYPLLTRNPPMTFGYGLSYTSFNFSSPKLAYPSSGNRTDTLDISVTVLNTGTYTGKEVVQLYFRQAYSAIEVPVKKLVRFTKIELAPKESEDVTFTVAKNDLGYYRDMEWQVESGLYTFYIGSSSKDADLLPMNVTIT